MDCRQRSRKPKEVKRLSRRNPGDTVSQSRPHRIRGSKTRRIEFEELDFNLGERWIPTGIYACFASHPFDADVIIHYSKAPDDFSVKCHQGNMNIWEKYAVKAGKPTSTALPAQTRIEVNTTPDITKSDGGDQEVKWIWKPYKWRITRLMKSSNRLLPIGLTPKTMSLKTGLTEQYKRDKFNLFRPTEL